MGLLNFLLAQFLEEKECTRREHRKDKAPDVLSKKPVSVNNSINIYEQLIEGQKINSDPSSVLVPVKIIAANNGFGLSLVQKAHQSGILIDLNHKIADLRVGDR